MKNMLDRCGSFILLGELKYGGILTPTKQKNMFDHEVSADMDMPLNYTFEEDTPKTLKKSEKVKEFDKLSKKRRKNSNKMRKLIDHKYTYDYKSTPVDTENKFVFDKVLWEIDSELEKYQPVTLKNGDLFWPVDKINAYKQKGQYFFFDMDLDDITPLVRRVEND